MFRFSSRCRMSLVTLSLAAAVVLALAPHRARAAGYWHLSAIRRHSPDKKDGRPAGILLPWRTSADLTATGMTTKMDYFDKKTGTMAVDRFHIHWSWSPIPVIAVPREKFPLKLTGTVVAYPTWKNGFVGLISPYVKAEWRTPTKVGAWGRGGGFTDAKGNGLVQFASGGDAAKKPKSITLQANGTVPDGREGSKVVLVFEIDHPKWWNWEYHYKWVTGAVPARRPAPVQPGRTRIGPGPDPDPTKPRDPDKPLDPSKPGDPNKPLDPNRPRDPDKPLDPNKPPDPTKPPDGIKAERPTRIPGLTLKADKRSVKAGETVFVPVWLLTARDIGNINFTVTFDPGVVQPAGKAKKGNLLTGSSPMIESNPLASSPLRIGLTNNQGMDGDGTVAQVPFRAVGAPGQRTALTLQVTTIHTTDNARPTIAVIHGEIEILTDSGEKLGDGDGDGKITLADAMLALQMSVKLIPEKLVCDVDRSGSVTSKDARLIVDMAWGDQR